MLYFCFHHLYTKLMFIEQSLLSNYKLFEDLNTFRIPTIIFDAIITVGKRYLKCNN